MRIVVAGYYGCGNVGDDALLAGLQVGLGNLPVKLTALSGNPDETFRYLGITSVPRRDFARVKQELEAADALVFAGGGLLQDVTSLFSLQYYAKLISLAKKLDKKVVMLAQGIGPVNSFFGKRTAAAALRQVDVITVRDPQSLQTMRSLGVNRPAEVTADLAWLAMPEESPEAQFELGSMKTVGIAPRPWGKPKDLAAAFGGFAQLLFKNSYVPMLVEMDRTLDTAILDQIAKLHGGRAPDIRNIHAPAQMLARLKRMHCVVAMRLHAGILAASAGVPPMMISYDPKVTAFANLLGLPNPLPADGLTPEKLWDAFQRFERDREAIKATILDRREAQIKAAKRNIDILIESFPALAGKN